MSIIIRLNKFKKTHIAVMTKEQVKQNNCAMCTQPMFAIVTPNADPIEIVTESYSLITTRSIIVLDHVILIEKKNTCPLDDCFFPPRLEKH